jgi:hypothetical protein
MTQPGPSPLEPAILQFVVDVPANVFEDKLNPVEGQVSVNTRRLCLRDAQGLVGVAKNAAWSNFASLKQSSSGADQVGNCVVFDLGNNRYRLTFASGFAGGHSRRKRAVSGDSAGGRAGASRPEAVGGQICRGSSTASERRDGIPK